MPDDDKTDRAAMGELFDKLTTDTKDEKTDDTISAATETTEDSAEADSGQSEVKPSEESTATSEASEEGGEETSELDAKTDPEKITAKESEVPVSPDKDVIPDAARPPDSWSATAKSKWAELDPIAQAEIIKREADSLRGVNQMREKADYGSKIKEIINPYTPTLKAQGVDDATIISTLLNTYHQLTTADPKTKGQLLMQTAQQFGADMTGLTGEPDPLQQHLNPLVQEITSLKQQIANQETQAKQQENKSMEMAIDKFASEVDETGQPKHPYMSNVMQEMIALMPLIGQSNPGASYSEILDQSYERAIWNNPETRALVQSRQAEQTAAQRQKEANEKALKAKKANSVNIGTEGSHDSTQPKPLGSVRDTMSDIYDNLTAQ